MWTSWMLTPAPCVSAATVARREMVSNLAIVVFWCDASFLMRPDCGKAYGVCRRRDEPLTALRSAPWFGCTEPFRRAIQEKTRRQLFGDHAPHIDVSVEALLMCGKAVSTELAELSGTRRCDSRVMKSGAWTAAPAPRMAGGNTDRVARAEQAACPSRLPRSRSSLPKPSSCTSSVPVIHPGRPSRTADISRSARTIIGREFMGGDRGRRERAEPHS